MNTPRTAWIALNWNIRAVICGLLFLFVVPIVADLYVCVNGTTIDRLGLYDREALNRLPPSSDFRDVRGAVPRFVALPAQIAACVCAILWILTAAANALAWRRISKECKEKSAAGAAATQESGGPRDSARMTS